jgi:hypothetical protein
MTHKLKHIRFVFGFCLHGNFPLTLREQGSQGTEGDIWTLKQARNWRLKKLRDEELHNLCFSPNIITSVK